MDNIQVLYIFQYSTPEEQLNFVCPLLGAEQSLNFLFFQAVNNLCALYAIYLYLLLHPHTLLNASVLIFPLVVTK